MALAQGSQPTLFGWFLRDAAITLAACAALWAMARWHELAPSWSSALIGPSVAFMFAYILCYIYHEWGHFCGATLSGGHMRLNPYRGALIGTFDIQAHTTRQFLALSWGGVLAYLSIMAVSVAVHLDGSSGIVGAGFAVGGLAFVFQSVAVDVPQIYKVTQGADPMTTNAQGANAAIIMRRTWQSWLVLAGLLVAWNLR